MDLPHRDGQRLAVRRDEAALEQLSRGWAAVVWLASDDARFVHGTTLDVDGGALHTYAT